MNVLDVLDRHGIVVRGGGRSKMIACPSGTHSDRHPSCAVHEDYVLCFTCQYNADAYGLEATLSGRPVSEVLKEKGDPTDYVKRPRGKSQRELREEGYRRWLDESQERIEKVRLQLDLEGQPEMFDLVFEQVEFVFDYMLEVFNPRDDEEAKPPYQLGQLTRRALKKLDEWVEKNT